jgi:hypothetical protein
VWEEVWWRVVVLQCGVEWVRGKVDLEFELILEISIDKTVSRDATELDYWHSGFEYQSGDVCEFEVRFRDVLRILFQENNITILLSRTRP